MNLKRKVDFEKLSLKINGDINLDRNTYNPSSEVVNSSIVDFIHPNILEFYKRNDLFVILKKIRTELFTNIYDCKRLWYEFSSLNTIFDTWEFRYSFWKGYKHKPHFIVLKNNGENVGLLPLWYEKDKHKYFWFGSWWQEENNFFVKDEIYTPLLLSICPKPVHLNAISLDGVIKSKNFFTFKPDEPKYILKLRGFLSVEDYLMKLNSKKRYNLKRDRKLIEKVNPRIILNNFSDFELMIKLSKKRFFEKGEETDWEDPRRVETFKEVIRQGLKGKSYNVRMITVKIGKRVAAVDLVAIYKKTYSPLKCGYDVKNFPGIGNFMNLYEINYAIMLGMDTIDFLEIDYGWKDRFFDAVPLFLYESN